jgi:hypothetical protein
MPKYIVSTKDDRIVLGWAYPTETHCAAYDADGTHYIKMGEGCYLHVETEAENPRVVILAYPFAEEYAKKVAEKIGGKFEFIP